MAKEQGYELHALSFRYGQRHERELDVGAEDRKFSARAIAQRNCLRSSRDRWFCADRPNRSPQGPQRSGNLPRHSHHLRARAQHDFSLLWLWRLPSASTRRIFFSAPINSTIAATRTVAKNIFSAFERMANLATKAGVEGKSRIRIHAPLLKMTKAEIIRAGLKLGLDYGLTWSCYDPACRWPRVRTM